MFWYVLMTEGNDVCMIKLQSEIKEITSTQTSNTPRVFADLYACSSQVHDCEVLKTAVLH